MVIRCSALSIGTFVTNLGVVGEVGFDLESVQLDSSPHAERPIKSHFTSYKLVTTYLSGAHRQALGKRG